MRRLLNARRVVALVLGLTLVAGIWIWVDHVNHTTIRARFANTQGLNVGDAVKVLGVPVGTVTGITDSGSDVLVTMRIDGDQPVPADARAAIVAPSLVSGRFVQLAPVWTGGPRLASGDTISVARTAVPLSFDDVKRQLTDLATTLGPRTGEAHGALAATISALSRSLRHGNSRRLRAALINLHGAAAALASGRSGLFGTIGNLDQFTRNLAINQAAVSGFTHELSSVGAVLATNRRTLGGAVRDLGSVLAMTRSYFARHHGRLVRTLRDLNLLTAAIADRSNELAGVLHVSPHALIGLHNAIENQAITVRTSTTDIHNPAQLVCGALLSVGGTTQECHNALTPLLGMLGLSSVGAP